MKIELIYRKNNPSFYSIEKVFGLVTEFIQHNHYSNIQIKPQLLPYKSNNIYSLLLNFFSLLFRYKDIVHITGDIHYAILALPRKRTILTIHDLVFLYTYKGITRWFLKWTYLILPVRKAKYITTVSSKSKHEIIRFTGCDPNKIIVIPNPVDPELSFQKKEFNQLKPILLYLGTKSNKNLELALLSLFGLSVHLRIIGELTELQLEILNKYKIEYSVANELSEEEIRNEYAQCDLVFFPSTYEGFGLPVIEGFKSGRPVISSNLEPMMDISSGAALLVDPYSVPSIRKGLIELINNPSLRDAMVEKGFEVVKQYEVSRIAEQYIDLWSGIAEKNKTR